MINKFLNYLKYSYHRPSAKFEHFLVLIFKIFFLSKTKIFSEKIMLLKFPPLSMIYLNSLGRLLYISINILSVLFFRKFMDKSISIENFILKEKNEKSNRSIGNDLETWPPQATHLFEKNIEVEDTFFDRIYLSYIKILKEKDIELKDSPWWNDLRIEFRKKFLTNNFVNKDNIINFRNEIDTKSAILREQNSTLSSKNSRFINMMNAIFLISLYHKYSNFVDLKILRSISDSKSGNNRCVVYRGQRLNQRILRYSYYMSQLINNTNIKYEDKIVICDIGGGYGGLIRLLKHYFINSTCILIELPETCLLASYFLKNNFPDSKVLLYSDFEDLGGDFNLKQYDFIILPQNMIKKLKNKSIDLTINTSSLSEMKNETQDFYFTEIERITNKYFYSVNRHKFKEQKYNAQGFYNLKFQKRWDTIIYNFTHTYQLEFLGRINEK